MIIPMKKITILTLKKYEIDTLNELQQLGVIHLNSNELKTVDAQDRIEAVASQGNLERLIGVLEQFKVAEKSDDSLDGKTLAKKAQTLLEEQEKLAQIIEVNRKQINDMEGWGDFNFAELENFQAQGLRLYLCNVATDDKLKEFKNDESLNFIELNRGKNGINFVLITDQKLDKAKLPLANINTEKTLSELKNELKLNEKKALEIKKDLLKIAENLPVIRRYRDLLGGEIEFLTARDAMEIHGEIACIDGFVPATMMDNVAKAAKNNSWGYLAVDADKNDVVPTLLEMPKWAKIITPLFDFLGINPGYNELDVSGPFTIFFCLFFGILMGDAGYGMLFMLISIFGLIKFKNDLKLKPIFKLVALLSCFAILWGLLSGNFFGTKALTQGLACLNGTEANPQQGDQTTQKICFLLGTIQIILGHLWRLVLDLKWRNVGSQLGWIAMMLGNYILVINLLVVPFPEGSIMPVLMPYFYGAGVALIAVCEVNWCDASSVFGFPSNLINSFVDLLSYIRLFAVGLAGLYLAQSFNGMAEGVMGSGVIGFIAGLVILLLGHLLNIALTILSIMVHGVRLNTLEFSNHIGLQWTGFAYKPFKKDN
jgi:V/A-type H+-transporting ATPase subunit I